MKKQIIILGIIALTAVHCFAQGRVEYGKVAYGEGHAQIVEIMLAAGADPDDDYGEYDGYYDDGYDDYYNDDYAGKITNKDVRKHCEGFIKCIKSGKYKKALKYFASEYIEEQHNGFLRGNTDQFLREFLSGNSCTGEDFIVPKKLSDIKSIKINEARVKRNEIEAKVIFEIELNTGVKYLVEERLSIDKKKLYLWGAYG